jgi:hypothetical protein
MGIEKLQEGFGVFCEEIDGRLFELSPAEQQQYLEGLFHAFDSIIRYAGPCELSPFEREQFINQVRSRIYSKTHDLKLDTSKMEKLIETEDSKIAESYDFAARLQKVIGIHLNKEQRLDLANVILVASLKKP